MSTPEAFSSQSSWANCASRSHNSRETSHPKTDSAANRSRCPSIRDAGVPAPQGLMPPRRKGPGVRHGPILLALATLSWVCLLHVGEPASVWVGNFATLGFLQFWNSKTREEGWVSGPLAWYGEILRA